jgi:tetratricopeptide (TPR) repeat protein
MKRSVLCSLAVLGMLAGGAHANDISDCKSGDHYTNLDNDYNACTRALTATGIDDKVKAELFFARGQTLYYGERFDLALEDLNEAIKLHPSYRDALYWRARTFYELNRIGDAMSELNSLIEQNPNDAEAIYVIGLIYEDASLNQDMVSNADEAIRYYEIATKINPDMLMARYHLAIVQTYRASTLPKAIVNFEKILAAKPEEFTKIKMSPRPNGVNNLKLRDRVVMQYLQAKVSANQDLGPKLFAELQDTIARNPLAAEPLQARSAYYFSKRKYEDALRDAKTANELFPRQGDIISIVLECYDALQRWQEGIDFANATLNGSYENFKPSYVLFKKAWFEEKLNKREDALSDYTASIQLGSFQTPSLIRRLIDHQYYDGQLSDTYNDKMRDGLKACIIDQEC